MLILLLSLVSTASALDILWIGNSYTIRNDLAKIVKNLALADGQELTYDASLKNGYTWQRHTEDETTMSKISKRPWDYVILQEQSQLPAFDENTICSASIPPLQILVDSILANNPNTMIQFFGTWGRPHGDNNNCPNFPQMCAFESMQDALTKSYSTFACMHLPSKLAPVGEVFRYVKENIDEALFESLYVSGDHHPSNVGSYVAALTHYASMFNTTVTGNTFINDLTPEVAALLQDATDQVMTGGDWDFPINDDCDLCLCSGCPN